jgi:DNA-binding MarR family transcriptional regulator
MSPTDGAVPLAILRAATQVTEAISAGLAARGFDDVRPAHAFAFARLDEGGATVVDLAAHLGITKQAASQLVEQLVQRDYVSRELNPADGRAWLLGLTARGQACAQAAQATVDEVTRRWRKQLDRNVWAGLDAGLSALVTPGRIRPSW